MMHPGGRLPLLGQGPSTAGSLPPQHQHPQHPHQQPQGSVMRSMALSGSAGSLVRLGLAVGTLALLTVSYVLLASTGGPLGVFTAPLSADPASGGAQPAGGGSLAGAQGASGGATEGVSAEAGPAKGGTAVRGSSERSPGGEAKGTETGTGEGALEEGPNPSRPSRCSDKCFERGTCNEATGECFCVTGYAGPDCGDLALPSCQITSDYAMPCKAFATCECLRECQKYRLPLPGGSLCFKGTDDNGTKITDIKRIVEGPLYPAQWNREVTDFLPQDYSRATPVVSPLADPSECPQRCSGRGACFKEHKNCDCSWAAVGAACEISPGGYGGLRVPCFNGCSGKGECVVGVCKCQKGFFGFDCSLYLGADGKPRILTRAPFTWAPSVAWPPRDPSLRPRIYVYDLPPYMNTWQGTHSHYMDWAEPIWFTERLHNTPYRTPNPEEADFFFLPLFIRNRGGNKANIVTLARDYVKAQFPFYNKSGGADHFVMTNSDWGVCEMGGASAYGERSPAVETISVLTLWGCSRNMHMEEKDACFRPGRDMVVPPDQDVNVYRFAPGIGDLEPKGGPDPSGNRSILLYFRGYPAQGLAPFGRGWFTWSFGVRQDMFRHFNGTVNRTGILLETMEKGPWDYWHLRQMLRSVFCLGPAGYGWGMRAPQAVLMGCIPVVIQPYTYQAFEGDGLDWNEFGVVLTKEDIPRLDQILRAISPEDIRKKQEAMDRVKMRLIWGATTFNPFERFASPQKQVELASALVEGDAFAGIMEGLRMRLQKDGKL